MIKADAWKDEGVIYRPTMPTEDFVVLDNHDPPGFTAAFVAGPSFQDLRFCTAEAASPRGPFKNPRRSDHRPDAHTRLYAEAPEEGELLITAAWPHAGNLGIWHFTDTGYGPWEKRLLIPPEGSYSVVAGNPTSLRDRGNSDRWHVVFEGRSEASSWQLFHAVFESGLRGRPLVSHLGPGANPRLVRHGEEVFLYYSDANFDVALKTQHA